MDQTQLPIGIFDSGLGGLSVLRTALRMLPNERFIYYGDIVNAPYGTKTEEEVCVCARGAAQRLLGKGIKALVIACNTATCAAACAACSAACSATPCAAGGSWRTRPRACACPARPCNASTRSLRPRRAPSPTRPESSAPRPAGRADGPWTASSSCSSPPPACAPARWPPSTCATSTSRTARSTSTRP